MLLAAGESRAAAVAMTNLGRAHWRHGNTVRARELAFEAVELLEPDPGPELVLAYGRLSAAEALGGRSEQAITWANKGIELAERDRTSRTSSVLWECGGSRGSTSATRMAWTTFAQRSTFRSRSDCRPRTPQSHTATWVRTSVSPKVSLRVVPSWKPGSSSRVAVVTCIT